MSRSHDRLTHTLRQFKTSLRTGATPVVPMRAAESGKCQTSISVVCVYSKLPLECVIPIIGSRDISRVFYADEHDT